jgi:hypothetical protein
MRRAVVVTLLLAVIAFGLFWETGRMDTFLSQFGLNKNTCVKNGFGATFCGNDAKNYQQNIANVLGSSGSSDGATLEAEVRSAVPSAEAYYSDNGNYIGMTVGAANAESYCLQAGSGIDAWSFTRPGDSVQAGPC